MLIWLVKDVGEDIFPGPELQLHRDQLVLDHKVQVLWGHFGGSGRTPIALMGCDSLVTFVL